MSDKVGNDNLYTTRASGELRERLDVYIEESDGKASPALRHLLDLGLQVEEQDGTPKELREQLEAVEEELAEAEERLEESERKREGYSRAAWLSTIALGVLFIGTGVLNTVNRFVIPVPDLSQYIAGISAIFFFVSMIYTLATALSPRLGWIQKHANGLNRRLSGLLPI